MVEIYTINITIIMIVLIVNMVMIVILIVNMMMIIILIVNMMMIVMLIVNMMLIVYDFNFTVNTINIKCYCDIIFVVVTKK